jgi:GDP-L-fucose synthase
MIQSNIIETAREYDVKKLLFLGSSCIYPKHSVVPISEWQLMTGPLEPTNDAYAIAKIAGIKMCQAYKQQYGFNAISLMPTNLYGPNDNFDDTTSHVLPALINRFHLAMIRNEKEVICWGDGRPMREFLYVDDLAKACIFLMNEYNDSEIINVGTGIDVTVKQLAETIASVVGYKGEIIWDTSKPNGTMRKVLNVEKINKLGWKSETSLRDGIQKTYRWYLDDINQKSSITL